MKATHILFTEGLRTEELSFTIEPITKDWHLTSNNFKGSYSECMKEGKRQRDVIRQRINQEYTEPHYHNAPYGSIWDY